MLFVICEQGMGLSPYRILTFYALSDAISYRVLIFYFVPEPILALLFYKQLVFENISTARTFYMLVYCLK
jgi:hypothetical protein